MPCTMILVSDEMRMDMGLSDEFDDFLGGVGHGVAGDEGETGGVQGGLALGECNLTFN